MAPGSHLASPLGFVNKVSLKHNRAVGIKDSNFAQDGGWGVGTDKRESNRRCQDIGYWRKRQQDLLINLIWKEGVGWRECFLPQ